MIVDMFVFCWNLMSDRIDEWASLIFIVGGEIMSFDFQAQRSILRGYASTMVGVRGYLSFLKMESIVEISYSGVHDFHNS